MSVIAGKFPIIVTYGMAYSQTFKFYNGDQTTGTPFDFTNKSVYIEVRDRSKVVKTYQMTTSAGTATLDILSVDIKPGRYSYKLVVVSGSRKESYIKDNFIVDA